LVAAIFAAAMSSLDSALNSLATASVVDVYARFFRPNADDARRLVVARRLTVAWGVLGVAAALYVAGRGGLLAMAVRYVGYFAGPVLGLFLLGLLFRRTNQGGAVGGVLAGFAAVTIVVNAERWFGTPPPVGGIWTAAVGCACTMAVGLALSQLWPPPGQERLDGLTVGTRPSTPTTPHLARGGGSR
jgi:SSS family solute:Na+ symporter